MKTFTRLIPFLVVLFLWPSTSQGIHWEKMTDCLRYLSYLAIPSGKKLDPDSFRMRRRMELFKSNPKKLVTPDRFSEQTIKDLRNGRFTGRALAAIALQSDVKDFLRTRDPELHIEPITIKSEAMLDPGHRALQFLPSPNAKTQLGKDINEFLARYPEARIIYDPLLLDVLEFEAGFSPLPVPTLALAHNSIYQTEETSGDFVHEVHHAETFFAAQHGNPRLLTGRITNCRVWNYPDYGLDESEAHLIGLRQDMNNQRYPRKRMRELWMEKKARTLIAKEILQSPRDPATLSFSISPADSEQKLKVAASWRSTGYKNIFGKTDYPVLAVEFVVNREVAKNNDLLRGALDEHLKQVDEYHDRLLKQYEAVEP
jgi:hypothetical protein